MLLRSCILLLTICFFSCGSTLEDSELYSKDLSGEVFNKTIYLSTPDGRIIRGYLSKPAGTNIDIVIALHGGTPTLEKSRSSTKDYIKRNDGGKHFLAANYGVLCLEYTEFESDGSKADRGFKELIDVLAATDFILNDSLLEYNITVDRVFAFGHSRGGNNALLAGIERQLDGVIAAEAPLDWVKTQDSIEAGVITGDPDVHGDLVDKFEESIANWTDEDFIKYSPGLRLPDFQTKFLIISGELDPAVLITIAEEVKEDYISCVSESECIEGGEFIFHPRGHTDWADVEIIQAIHEFIN